MRLISKDLCGGAEISSKRCSGDNKRRLTFLSRISGLPFRYCALVINKDRLPPDSGFQFKRSFYKCINRMLYERLIKAEKSVRIIADTIGGADFMDSFQEYLEKKGVPSLFQQFEHKFADSKHEPLIQLADLVAGSLSYCFDPLKQTEYSLKFRELLRPRELSIQCWPWQATFDSTYDSSLEISDTQIREPLTKRVITFLKKYENSIDDDRRMQFITLDHLLFARQFESRERQAIYAETLIARLKAAGFQELSSRAFLSRVIGKIRDEGIILAGSTDGYRLALSVEDIREYLLHDGTIIGPMLARIQKAKESVVQDTEGKLDILDAPAFLCLKKLIASFNDFNIQQGVLKSQSLEEEL
jgi:hypothetical protein